MLPGKRNSTGEIYVLQGPPPAGTPFVGGIAVSHDGAIYVSQAFTPPFSPADLFASGEQGAWYDPSDLTTMFQDRAGTTPVTADGQTVGKILDKSGRGNHATAPSDAARPLYKTDGTYHWLQFDGVDDSLSTAAIDFTATPVVNMFFGLIETAAIQKLLIRLGPNIVTTFPSFQVFYPNTAAQYSKVQIQDAAGYTSIDTANGITANKQVFVSALNVASTRRDGKVPWFRLNGVQTNAPVDSSVVSASVGLLNDVLNIGGYVGLYGSAKLYSVIVRGAMSTTDEITNTETWVNGKTGAY